MVEVQDLETYLCGLADVAGIRRTRVTKVFSGGLYSSMKKE